MKFVGATAVPSIQLKLDEFGPSGTQGEMHVIAPIPDESRTDEQRLNDTSLRAFKAYGLLSKLPPTAGSVNAAFTQADGSSYFLMPEEKHVLKIDTTDGTFFMHKNATNELSFIEFECVATSIPDARNKFYSATLLFLDHLSYAANSPVFISMARIEDVPNHRISFAYTEPFRPMTIDDHANRLFIEMKPIYAMYREAKNANSDFYRFLCYFKILEGLLGKMRAELRKRAKTANVSISTPAELVPDSQHYAEILKPYIGQSIKKFYDDVLEPKFRDAIAHFQLDDRTILQMSDPEHINQYSTIMLICENCVRVVISNHEAMLAQIPHIK